MANERSTIYWVLSFIIPIMCILYMTSYEPNYIRVQGVKYDLNHMKRHPNNYNLSHIGDMIRDDLMNHPIYNSINTTDKLAIFMSRHVYAVWDFMVLLKSLQIKYTNVNMYWTPPENMIAARMINMIVLGEETDDIDGVALSHLELYIRAMNDSNIPTKDIMGFIKKVSLIRGDVSLMVKFHNIPPYIKEFILNTLSMANSKSVITASAFLYGREDPIPEMFSKIVSMGIVDTNVHFKKYLERHIELDHDHHAPMARKFIDSIIKNDNDRNLIQLGRIQAINARIKLWDGIYNEIVSVAIQIF
jgi:hypothetical protein